MEPPASEEAIAYERPLAEPIWQVSDYSYRTAQDYAEAIAEEKPGYIYGRYGGPNAHQLSARLAEAEGKAGGWVFSSGMAAVHAALMQVVRASPRRAEAKTPRILAGRTLYGGTYGLLMDQIRGLGIEVEMFDAASPPGLDDCDAVFVEAIANPTFELADISATVAAAGDSPVIVDNTVPSPALLRPGDQGAHLIIHASSKYIGGHHDVMGGAVLGDRRVADELRSLAIAFGTTASGFESWLVGRGMHTLELRMARHSSNAQALAQVFEDSNRVERVIYPGLASHPQHRLAVRIMTKGFGGMLAIDLGTRARAWKLMDSMRLVRVGSSFGGVFSETTHPASTSHRQFSEQDRKAAGITDGLVRVSVGIEDPAALIEDVQGALKSL